MLLKRETIVVASSAKMSVSALFADLLGYPKPLRSHFVRLRVFTKTLKRLPDREAVFCSSALYSMIAYFTLIRSSFSKIGNPPNHRKTQVANACTQSTGKPVA